MSSPQKTSLPNYGTTKQTSSSKAIVASAKGQKQRQGGNKSPSENASAHADKN